MNELVRAATQMARGAGGLLRDAYQKPGGEVKRKSTLIDLVTDADRASEEYLLGEIERHFPDHAVLAEESGVGRAEGPFRWVIDPLDGTVNFAHRLPVFSVLIAVQEKTAAGFTTIVAVTHDPLRDETFSATLGGGTFLDGAPVHVSTTVRLIDAILTTGFAYDRLWREDDNHREFCRLNLLSRGVRRLGSAGLDLAYVACGRIDASWEYHLNPWDVAGGMLLVSEAGGRVSDIHGSRADPSADSLVASNGHLHADLQAALLSAGSLPAASREGLSAFLPPEIDDSKASD
jgi:myo-inositol-1(or 4)-monophosphatase